MKLLICLLFLIPISFVSGSEEVEAPRAEQVFVCKKDSQSIVTFKCITLEEALVRSGTYLCYPPSHKSKLHKVIKEEDTEFELPENSLVKVK